MYHVNSVQEGRITALTIQIESNESSDSDVNVEDVKKIALIHSMGCTIEVKVEPVTAAAINECFFNMFGSGSRLITMQLEMDYIVELVKIYGIVDPTHAQSRYEFFNW